MIGLMYVCLFQYILYLITFVIFFYKGIIYNNYFALIPVIGIVDVIMWFLLTFPTECISKKEREEEKVKEKYNLEHDKYTSLKNKLYTITERIIVDTDRYYRFHKIEDINFSQFLNEYITISSSRINNDKLYNSIRECIVLIRYNKTAKAFDVFSNMIETIYEIINIDNEIKISDEIINEIIELCENYKNTLRQIIAKDNKEKEKDVKRRSDKFNKTASEKIKNLNSVLKDIQKDYKNI